MAESTLSLLRSGVRERLALYMGEGTDADNWDSDVVQRMNLFIRDGQARFFYPIPDTESETYEWTFLRPTTTLAISSGTQAYALPDDCGGQVDRFVITTGTAGHLITMVSVDDLLQSVAREAPSNAIPKFAAVRTTHTTPTTSVSQRYEVLFYPTPDASYTVSYSYTKLVDGLDENSSAEYALGGPQHHQTLVESVLAVAEEYLRPDETSHQQRFQQLLTASIGFDRRIKEQESNTWLITEPTIHTFEYYEREIGVSEGYSGNPKTWGYTETQTVNSIMQRGLKVFYVPPPLEGRTNEGMITVQDGHQWSFLKPVGTLSLVNTDYQYDLAAGFQGIDGEMTYAVGTASTPIAQIGEAELRAKQSNENASGAPQFWALTAGDDSYTGATEHVYEALFYPTPDASYTVTYRYTRTAPILTTTKYPLGGVGHSQTILAAMKMVAAEKTEMYPQMREIFMTQLTASVEQDRQLEKSLVMSFSNTAPAYGKYEWLQQELGMIANLGPNPKAWTQDEIRMINSLIQRGVRKFYMAPDLEVHAHRWRFLYSETTLTTNAPYSTGTLTVVSGVATLAAGTFPSWAASGLLVVNGIEYQVSTRDSGSQVTLDDTSVTAAAGTAYSLYQRDYDLPANFQSIQGRMTYHAGSAEWYPIKIMANVQLREWRSTVTTSGYPRQAAVFTKLPVATSGTLHQISFLPNPDASYVLTYEYKQMPVDIITGDFPYGGEQHADTILAACKACYNKEYASEFAVLLKASISLDSTDLSAETLGMNRDGSDSHRWDDDNGIGSRLNGVQLT